MKLRYVIRDGEKVLKEVAERFDEVKRKFIWMWVDYGHIPTVNEETGEEIKQHEPNTGR